MHTNQSNTDFNSLSVRAKNVLKNNRINRLEYLIEYFKENGSNFKKFRNCGVKTEKEIQAFCESHIAKYSKLTPSLVDSSLQEFEKAINENKQKYGNKIVEVTKVADPNACISETNLSVRAKNCCQTNKIITVSALIDFYNKEKYFLGWRNIGKKTNKELHEFCKYINDSCNIDISYSVLLEYDCFLNKDDLILKNLALSLKNNNNINHVDLLMQIIESEYSFCDIYNLIVNDSDLVQKIFNNNNKTIKTITTSLKNILNYLVRSDPSAINKENFQAIYFENYINNIFKHEKKDVINQYALSRREEISDSDFKIFDFYRYITADICIFGEGKEREQMIYSATKGFYAGDKRTLESIGSEHGITRERVRQISNNAKWERKNNSFWTSISGLLEFTKYHRIKRAKYIVVDNKFVNYFNSTEKVVYSSTLYTVALKGLLHDTHDSCQIALPPNAKDTTSIFIFKEINKYFDFAIFMRDIVSEYYKKNNKTYHVSLKKYVMKYYLSGGNAYQNELLDVCESLVRSILDSEIMDGSIVFKRNTKYKMFEYPYEIIAEANVPMTIDEIIFKCAMIFPEKAFTKESLRAAMINNDLFIYFGRTSTYGLKEWEKDKDIKGGTIRKMVEELLEASEKPLHLDEITEYVRKYRDTGSSSIQGNLRLETKTNIEFLPMGFYALKGKNYSMNISYKKFPVNIYNYVRKLLINVGNKYDYGNLIEYFSSKYEMESDMIKLLIDKEINCGFLSIEENLKVSLNDGYYNITNFKFTKYFNEKDKNQKELENLFYNLILAIELILIERNCSLYSIKKEVELLNVFELHKITLNNLLEDYPNFSNEDGVWTLKYCNQDTEVYYSITKEHDFNLSDNLLNVLIANMKSIEEVKRYITLDVRFIDSNKKKSMFSKEHDVLDDIIKEFDFE